MAKWRSLFNLLKKDKFIIPINDSKRMNRYKQLCGGEGNISSILGHLLQHCDLLTINELNNINLPVDIPNSEEKYTNTQQINVLLKKLNAKQLQYSSYCSSSSQSSLSSSSSSSNKRKDPPVVYDIDSFDDYSVNKLILLNRGESKRPRVDTVPAADNSSDILASSNSSSSSSSSSSSMDCDEYKRHQINLTKLNGKRLQQAINHNEILDIYWYLRDTSIHCNKSRIIPRGRESDHMMIDINKAEYATEIIENGAMLIKLPINNLKRTLSRSSILHYMKDTIPNFTEKKEQWSNKRCTHCYYRSGDQPLIEEHHNPPMKCYDALNKPFLTTKQLQLLCPHHHIDDIHAFICRHSWRMKTKQKCHYMNYDGVLPSSSKKRCDPYLNINFFYREEDWKETKLFGTGIATPMSYLSTMLSQFCWHKEDAGLLSVNIIMLSPDYNPSKPHIAKIWFIIPMRNAEKFWKYLQEKKGKTQWSKDAWWLPPLEIIKECEMKLFVQHEGEMIITGPFAPHCGINAYPSHAESVNTMFPHAVPAWFKECHNEQLKLKPFVKELDDDEEEEDEVQKKINIAYQTCTRSVLAANLDTFALCKE